MHNVPKIELIQSKTRGYARPPRISSLSVCTDLAWIVLNYIQFYKLLQMIRDSNTALPHTPTHNGIKSCVKLYIGVPKHLSLNPVVKLVKTRRKSLVSNKVNLQMPCKLHEKTADFSLTRPRLSAHFTDWPAGNEQPGG